MRQLFFLAVISAIAGSCGGSLASTSGEGKLFMRTMSWGGSLDISWYYVTRDNIVVNPVGGADPVDMAVETSRNARNVASYRVLADGRWEVKWGDGRTQAVRVERNGGQISAFDGGLMSLAKPFNASRFEDLTYSGLVTAGQGQVSRVVKIFFGKNGQFKMNRVGAVSTGSEPGMSERVRQGTYNIKGNTVHFKYSDGTEWKTVGQPYDLGNGEIILGDQLFKKAQ